MKVQMVVQTVHNGEVLRPGDVVDVESADARRWIMRRLAEALPAPDPVPEPDEPVDPYAVMSTKERYDLARERGINAQGMKKSEIIEALHASEPAEPGEPAEQTEGERVTESGSDEAPVNEQTEGAEPGEPASETEAPS